MPQPIGFYSAALIVAALSAACDGGARGGVGSGAPSSAPGTASAPPPPGATVSQGAVSAEAPYDATDFCTRLCDKSAACGVSKAETLARTSGDRREKDVVKSARAALPEVKTTCRAACMKEPPASATDARATAAEACMSKDDCEAFSACLDAI